MVSRRDKDCFCASGAEVAEPAQRATELARRRRRGLQGHRGRPWGHQPWPGGGWRRGHTAGLRKRKASELFKHSCTNDSQNEPPPSHYYRALFTHFMLCMRFGEGFETKFWAGATSDEDRGVGRSGGPAAGHTLDASIPLGDPGRPSRL